MSTTETSNDPAEDLKLNIERDEDITFMVISDARAMPALLPLLSSQRSDPLS